MEDLEGPDTAMMSGAYAVIANRRPIMPRISRQWTTLDCSLAWSVLFAAKVVPRRLENGRLSMLSPPPAPSQKAEIAKWWPIVKKAN
jgi:hypothetical protein